MILTVIVEGKTFEINVGIGLNDLAWLALAAARLYGKAIYPQGNYIPIILLINNVNKMIHPRHSFIHS